MEFPLQILQLVLSIGLIAGVLAHAGKDGGLSGAFGVGGGSGSLGSGSMMERNVTRWTIAMAVLWVLNTI
ncbi:MAG: preprotein translocase subunit SecG, partial [Solirubrobacteraceae bacterium]|nr:preprotein translocase subunit SecG [Solirubrobacteraceae bacterium]